MNQRIIKLIIFTTIVTILLAGCNLKSSHKGSTETPEEISAILKDYKLVGVGDSLMRGLGGHNGSFCEYLEKDYGVITKNYSENGAVWSSVTTSLTSYKTKLSRIMKKGIDKGNYYDILLLEGGINTIGMLKDINSDATEPSELIGSMDELDDITKVSGLVDDNISVVYDYFKSPGRYIFFIYPAVPEIADDEYFTAYKNFMINYCKAKDIVMIDLNDIGMEYNDTYYSVGAHFTDKGYKLASDYVAKIIAQTIASETD